MTPTQLVLVKWLSECSRAWSVSLPSMLGGGRTRDLFRARRAFVLLARAYTTGSYPEIAVVLNKRAHSSMIALCRTGMRDIRNDRTLQDFVALGYFAGVNAKLRLETGDKSVRDEVSYATAAYMDRTAPEIQEGAA